MSDANNTTISVVLYHKVVAMSTKAYQLRIKVVGLSTGVSTLRGYLEKYLSGIFIPDFITVTNYI